MSARVLAITPHSRFRRGALTLAVLVSLAGVAVPRAAGALPPGPRDPRNAALVDWPQFHGTVDRLGLNSEESQITTGTAPNLSLKWSFDTGGEIWSSPAVVDGIVYIGSDDKKVYALDAETGADLWSFATSGEVRSSPAVSDGRLYVGTSSGTLYALDATYGTELWTFEADKSFAIASPLVADGKVFIGSLDGNFYALDQSTGALLWSVDTWAIHGSAAISGDTVYFGSDESTVFAVDATTGAVRWTATTGGWVRNTPSVADGVVYVGADDYKLYAFDAATGAKRWESPELPGNGIVRSTPAVYDGRVYVDTGETDPMSSHFYAFDQATGIEVCDHEMADYATSSVAIAGGVAFAGSFSHQLYAFDPSTCDKLWDSGFTLMDGGVPSSPAIVNGVVFVGSLDSKMYAFAPTDDTPVSTFISILDGSFDPSPAIGHDIGTAVRWTNEGSKTHTVTDATGMDLYDSGSIAPGDSWSLPITAACIYKYEDSKDSSIIGKVKAPVVLDPSTGSTSTVFTVTWATEAPPSGYVFDVKIRRPGGEWELWKSDVTSLSATFVPDAGKGDYDFRAHLAKTSNGTSCTYSAFKTIVVS